MGGQIAQPVATSCLAFLESRKRRGNSSDLNRATRRQTAATNYCFQMAEKARRTILPERIIVRHSVITRTAHATIPSGATLWRASNPAYSFMSSCPFTAFRAPRGTSPYERKRGRVRDHRGGGPIRLTPKVICTQSPSLPGPSASKIIANSIADNSPKQGMRGYGQIGPVAGAGRSRRLSADRRMP